MPSPHEAVTLSDDWRDWVVDNLVHGAARDDVVAALIHGGVPPDVAEAEVHAIAASPLLVTCARLTVARERRDQLLELLLTLRRGQAIERRPRVPADELFDRYWATSTPVVLTSLMDEWPARRWSFDDLRRRVGHVEIEVSVGRAGDPACDRVFDRHRTTMGFADYLDRVEGAGTTNDLYLIAHNRAMERPGMGHLLDDVIVDDAMFDRDALVGGSTLWVGPAGTRTTLHHDSTNILFCQIQGRKRFWLIPPFEGTLLDDAEGFFGTFDPSTPRDQWPGAHRDVALHELVLEPGEALFLPAGWWHQVDALDPSISLSLLAFRRPNRFDAYAPGTTRVVAASGSRG